MHRRAVSQVARPIILTALPAAPTHTRTARLSSAALSSSGMCTAEGERRAQRRARAVSCMLLALMPGPRRSGVGLNPSIHIYCCSIPHLVCLIATTHRALGQVLAGELCFLAHDLTTPRGRLTRDTQRARCLDTRLLVLV